MHCHVYFKSNKEMTEMETEKDSPFRESARKTETGTSYALKEK